MQNLASEIYFKYDLLDIDWLQASSIDTSSFEIVERDRNRKNWGKVLLPSCDSKFSGSTASRTGE